MKKWIVIAVLAVIVGGAIVAAQLSPDETVQVAQARRGKIREFVDEKAKTRLPVTHQITMPFAGRIEPIALVENQPVSKGDVVARMVEADLKDATDAAQAVVDRFEASIEEQSDTSVEEELLKQTLLLVESMADTVAARQKEREVQQNQLDFAESQLARVRQSSVSEAEQERAKLAYDNAKVEMSQLEFELQATEAQHAATALMPGMIRAYIQRKGLGVTVMQKQLTEAQTRLREQLRQQQRGDIKSPVDGVILERLISNEQFLPAGTTLLRIGELEKLEVEAEVLSQDAAKIREGDAVEIYGPAIGAEIGHGVGGTVHRMHPAAFTKISSLGVEQQRVIVVIRFAHGVLSQLRQAYSLGVDYSVRVRIFTNSKTDALIIPRSALFRAPDGQSWQVFAVRNGRAQLQDVKTGLMNDEEVEILDGLTAEDRVVLAPEASLTDGMKVKTELRE